MFNNDLNITESSIWATAVGRVGHTDRKGCHAASGNVIIGS
jgi:hypothetical protein